MASFYARFLKRGCDLVAAVVLTVVLLPAMAVVAVAVWLALGLPILHRDERAGLAGRTIRIAKFRSMTNATGPDGRLLPDSARLGSCGGRASMNCRSFSVCSAAT